MRTRHRYTSVPEGRFLDLILTLDLIDAGFAGWLMRLPADRQQVMFAVLVKAGAECLRPSRASEPLAPLIADDLLQLRPVTVEMRRKRSRDLIETHYGSCPDGLLGAFGKTTSGPQAGSYYFRLHRIFSDFDQTRLAKVIRQLQSLDLERLNVLTTLNPIFLSVNFVEKVRSVEQANDLNEALRLIQEAVGENAPDAALRASVEDVGRAMSLRDWIASWLYCAGSIVYPHLDLGSEWIALDSGQKLTECGLRNKVCLRDPEQLVSALSGQFAYFENRRLGVIVEIQAIGPQRHLMLVGIHGPSNRPVRSSVREQVRAEFLAAGVPCPSWTPERSPWSAVGRLIGNEFDGLDLFDRLGQLEEESA